MPRYSVTVEWRYTIAQTTTVEVEADSKPRAMSKAEDVVSRDPHQMEWEDVDDILDANYEAIEIEVIE